MHIRDQNSNNFHGQNRSDHKLKVHHIPTNTPQKELHQIDLQENSVVSGKRHLWVHEDPFYAWRARGCEKSGSGESVRGDFTQVRAARMCNTLVLLWYIFECS